MNDKTVSLGSSRVSREKKLRRVFLIIIILFFLLLLLAYFVTGIIYNRGNFSISLDKNLNFEKGLIAYDDSNYKVYRSDLYALAPETYDNISYTWIPDNVDNGQEGSHNGDNYLAYTFFVENQGESVSDFWAEMVIDDVIKNVDEAVRIRVYKDGVATTYAKKNRQTGAPERLGRRTNEYTTPFLSDDLVMEDHVENFKPGDIIRYTVVIWIEGNDPDCTDNILGGEFKVHMDLNSEHMDE